SSNQIAEIHNAENLIGGTGNDTLTGNNEDNLLEGGAGDDTLSGLEGDDTFRFADGWGQDTVSDSDGKDTLDFSQVTEDLLFDLGRTPAASEGGASADDAVALATALQRNVLVTDSTNRVTTDFDVEKFVKGQGANELTQANITIDATAQEALIAGLMTLQDWANLISTNYSDWDELLDTKVPIIDATVRDLFEKKTTGFDAAGVAEEEDIDFSTIVGAAIENQLLNPLKELFRGAADATVNNGASVTTDEIFNLGSDAVVVDSYALVDSLEARQGTLNFNSDGSYSYSIDPASDFLDLANGEAQEISFSYRVTYESGAHSDPETVTFVVARSDSGELLVGDTVVTDLASGTDVLTDKVTAEDRNVFNITLNNRLLEFGVSLNLFEELDAVGLDLGGALSNIPGLDVDFQPELYNRLGFDVAFGLGPNDTAGEFYVSAAALVFETRVDEEDVDASVDLGLVKGGVEDGSIQLISQFKLGTEGDLTLTELSDAVADNSKFDDQLKIRVSDETSLKVVLPLAVSVGELGIELPQLPTITITTPSLPDFDNPLEDLAAFFANLQIDLPDLTELFDFSALTIDHIIELLRGAFDYITSLDIFNFDIPGFDFNLDKLF
ncbi:MAG: calcium-binding protein, partial [Pseudomonadota bacterium]|nr:calcium-binding protein [Pseudomonadota bacterium]